MQLEALSVENKYVEILHAVKMHEMRTFELNSPGLKPYNQFKQCLLRASTFEGQLVQTKFLQLSIYKSNPGVVMGTAS